MEIEKIYEKLSRDVPENLQIHFQVASQSTMTEIKPYAAPVLLLADQQTQAHGRFSRPFFTVAGGGIYFSLKISDIESGTFPTIITAVALCQTIEKLTTAKPMIKWVNDLYLQQKKLAGILATRVISSADVYETIIGVGLNFNIPENLFPETLVQQATSLFSGNPVVSQETFIATFLNYFFANLKKDSKEILTFYKSRSFVLGREVSFQQNQKTYIGYARDIMPDGALLVELANHEKIILHSGEISLKTW